LDGAEYNSRLEPARLPVDGPRAEHTIDVRARVVTGLQVHLDESMIPRTGLPQAATPALSTTFDAAPPPPAVDSHSAFLTFKPTPPARSATSDPVYVAASLARLVDSVTGSDSSRAAWRAISDVAATLVPGADQAGVVVCEEDRRSDDAGDAATGDVQLLMKVQDHTGEGPCRDAARTGEQVLVHDLRSEARWPQFTPRTPWHIHSMLCTPIPVPDQPVRVLTVVSARAWAFDETSARLATAVAAHAAMAVRLMEQIRNLRAMADSREVIGQATGILMQQHQLTAEQAFHALARASHERNVKLRTLAGQLTAALTFPDSRPEGVDHAHLTDLVDPAGGGRPPEE
jgi:hypothetical protein